jgi:RNA polymerase sigma-70 factor (ECF subfamily)
LLAAEASLEMNEALEKLDASTRQMLLMRHFGQMSFKEIAEMFNCPIGTVLARVHRGMAALRKIMCVKDDD